MQYQYYTHYCTGLLFVYCNNRFVEFAICEYKNFVTYTERLHRQLLFNFFPFLFFFLYLYTHVEIMRHTVRAKIMFTFIQVILDVSIQFISIRLLSQIYI